VEVRHVVEIAGDVANSNSEEFALSTRTLPQEGQKRVLQEKEPALSLSKGT